jgi:hypothetical protein
MNTHLIEVKSELYRKYRRLALHTKSTPRRKSWLLKAQTYRLQVFKLGGTV